MPVLHRGFTQTSPRFIQICAQVCTFELAHTREPEYVYFIAGSGGLGVYVSLCIGVLWLQEPPWLRWPLVKADAAVHANLSALCSKLRYECVPAEEDKRNGHKTGRFSCLNAIQEWAVIICISQVISSRIEDFGQLRLMKMTVAPAEKHRIAETVTKLLQGQDLVGHYC